MNWHQYDINKLFEMTGSRVGGLETPEAEQKSKQFGTNELRESKRKSAIDIFVSQFKDLMIVILFAAAIISGIAGEWKDAIVILIIVIGNAIIGFVQEYRAEKAMQALQKMAVT